MILLSRICRYRSLNRFSTTYERKTPLEHILLRPEMYIGQTDPVFEATWTMNSTGTQMEKSNLAVSPGLLKVILVSALVITYCFNLLV